MTLKKIAAVSVLALFLSVPARALIITPPRLAYIDVEKVYENLYIVHQARTALEALIEEKKEEVEEVRLRIEDIKNIISLIEDNEDVDIKDKPDLPDDPSEAVEELKVLLEEKEEEEETLRQESARIIRDKDRQLRSGIMARIYSVLEELGEKEGYTAIFDGDVVFTSADYVENITDRVIEILNAQAETED